GFVEDMRVRWAIEEIGLPYRVRLVGGAGGEKSPEHLADQPFGQVPVYKESGLTLFESGAILIHLGDKDARLLPVDSAQRARAIGWTIAALNSVEPMTQMLFVTDFASQGMVWHDEAKAAVRPFAEARLSQLSKSLGESEWLEESFTIGDLLMIDVLRAVSEPELLAAHPNLVAYVERGTTRPAFKRAMAAHLVDLAETP
ncbi:MAG: glutathione S-transferase family protein, partial [Pseudomonadota bacterium]|nr:glutathione S-transferase family protein [Pseudomonadota bacterium]